MNRLGQTMLNKGSEAMENNSARLKVQGCVGFGRGNISLTPFLLFIVFLWYERLI
jgi:hypothetical protein